MKRIADKFANTMTVCPVLEFFITDSLLSPSTQAEVNVSKFVYIMTGHGISSITTVFEEVSGIYSTTSVAKM